jgi:hypothetical protein
MGIFNTSILAAFGLVNVHFARLELQLSLNTAKLIDPDDLGIGNIVTAGMDMRRTLDLFASLVIHRTPLGLGLPGVDDIRNSLPQIISRMDQIRDKRNIIVHSYWESGEMAASTPTAIRFKQGKSAKRGYEAAIETWTISQLQEFVAEIQRADEALREFVSLANRHMGLFPGSSDVL